MKLAVLGSNNIWAIENHFVKHFKALNVDVSMFPNHTIFLKWHGSSVVNKVLYKLFPTLCLYSINRNAIKHVRNSKCDAVLVFKGMEIYPSTVKKIQKLGIRTINYNPDHPFVFHGLGSGNKFVKHAIKFYDLYLTYSETIKKEIEDNYGITADVIPFGFDLALEEYKISQGPDEINAVCFVGNPDVQRADFLTKLTEDNIPVVVYGDDWDQFFSLETKVKIHKKVHEAEFWMALRKYRVQINLFRSHNLNSHNMRSFEVPSVGGIMLAPRTIEHTNFFVDNKEAFYYDGYADCVSQCKRILAMTADESNVIRKAARDRSVNDRYSYQDRAQMMLDTIEEIVHKNYPNLWAPS